MDDVDRKRGNRQKRISVPVENFLMQFCRIYSSGATPRQNPKGNRKFYFIVARGACHANFFAQAKALSVIDGAVGSRTSRRPTDTETAAIFETSIDTLKQFFRRYNSMLP